MRNLAYIFLSLLILITSCSKGPKEYRLQGLAQGTYFYITYYSNKDQTETINSHIDKIFDSIDASVSLWNPNSIVNKINNNQNTYLDEIFIDNLTKAIYLAEITEGSFDITIGGLVEAYGFAAKEKAEINDHIIDSLLVYVDYSSIELREDTLIKKYRNTKLNFNAIAQGYTTDKIAEYLLSIGVDSFIIDVGGEVRASGKKPNNQVWTCAIETPNLDNPSQRIYDHYIELDNESIVTSGDYRKFYEEDGKKVSHTIDPKTGRNVEHNLISVAVTAPTATEADALATAFMVMGKDKSLAWLKDYPEYQAYFILIDQDGSLTTYATPNLEQRLIKN